MTKQEAVLRMLIPNASNLADRKAEWEDIDKLIDFYGELYERVAETFPEDEPDEDEEDIIDDDVQETAGYGMGSDSDWDTDLPFKVVHGKFDETVTKDEADIIDKYMEKQNEYIPYKEIK